MNDIRTRFAPSPTGYLHVGGLRTALYAYLVAKKNNGAFILRIEDTDKTREAVGGVENIIKTLEWAGLPYDEGPVKGGSYGPYIQSERLPLYKKHAEQLIEQGHAYYCFCSSERLTQVRERQIAAKQPPAYDKYCRNIDPEEAKKRVAEGQSHVIRMKVPLEGESVFTDIIRGIVSISYKNVDDQVIIKSDGFPTYHLAVVVDDHEMKISHTIRGEEWLPSTPKHLLLYQYFGWHPPLFAHLPLLLNPDRSKLSKRQGDVAVEDYREKGYLKEALINFIALLGWNPGDTREIFTLEELVQEFSLERVGKAGAIFNIEKLLWMNEQHLRRMSDDELATEVSNIIQSRQLPTASHEYLKQVIHLMKERAQFVKDFVDNCVYFYQDPTTFDEKAKAKNWTVDTTQQMSVIKEAFTALVPFDAQTTEAALRAQAEKLQLSPGKLIHPLRLALTGQATGPSLFHLIEVLGKQTVLRRLEYAIKNIV